MASPSEILSHFLAQLIFNVTCTHGKWYYVWTAAAILGFTDMDSAAVASVTDHLLLLS